MLRKRSISIILVFVLISTVFSSFVFATGGGGGCPTTADYYVTGTVKSDETFKIYKTDIPGLESEYYIDNENPFCESCGDADLKGSYPNRYIEYDPEGCCGTITFFFKVEKQERYEECHNEWKCDKRWHDGHWEYYNCHNEQVCEWKTRDVDKIVKVTLNVAQSYDYEVTATINSGQIYRLYENNSMLPEGSNIKDKFYCSSGVCGELDYKRVSGPDYIQYIPYVEECSDCHRVCPESYRCDCEWVCEGCENRDCCGDNTFYFKIEVEEEYQYWEDHCYKSGGHWHGCSKTGTRTVDKIVKAIVTVNCAPPCETAPIANDDSYKTNENACATFNVIENDIDPDDLTTPDLTIVDVTVPEYGTATISGNKIYYCPLGNYCGEDTFYYQIATENGCDKSNYAKVTVTIPCKTPLSETILYKGLGVERLTVPATGFNVISNGQVVGALEIIPGTQSILVEVENRGFLTQADVGLRFEGLPEGVTYTVEPKTQKISAENTEVFIVNITAPPSVLEGTYTVKATVYSKYGLDQSTFNVVIK